MPEKLTISLQPDANSRAISFPLFAKKVRLGDVEIKHVWMEKTAIYGQRGKSKTLAIDLADSFWAICVGQGEVNTTDLQQIYLLARLAPESRSNASRDVFNDAHFSTKIKLRQDVASQIEKLLQGYDGAGYTPEKFRIVTRQLGPCRMNVHSNRKYTELADVLMTDACRMLPSDREGAIALSLQRWNTFQRQWGRRTGFKLEKKILDILSYECRAALHRCYAALWDAFLPTIKEAVGLDDRSEMFLRFWHGEWTEEAPRTGAMVSMFHGHVFALHPGASLLLKVPTGKRILGDFLGRPSNRTRGHLLWALCVCFAVYKETHDRVKEERRRIRDGKKTITQKTKFQLM